MAPVHLYLATWVLGGVLLGAEMLLDARARGARVRPEGALQGLGPLGREGAGTGMSSTSPPRQKPPAVFMRLARVTPLGLIGFGLSGLLAKGLEFEFWPGTFLIALSVGLGLIALGYRLSRVRVSASDAAS